MRRGYLDRARYLGDPDFVKMPIAKLTSKSYAKTLASSIRPVARIDQRRARTRHRHADRVDRGRRDHAILRSSTARGTRCRNTFTLEGGFGSHVVVDGAGFILNNEMGDFNKKPGARRT